MLDLLPLPRIPMQPIFSCISYFSYAKCTVNNHHLPSTDSATTVNKPRDKHLIISITVNKSYFSAESIQTLTLLPMDIILRGQYSSAPFSLSSPYILFCNRHIHPKHLFLSSNQEEHRRNTYCRTPST